MRCPTEFSDSFAENIGALKRYEAQIAEVVKGLQDDAYYQPSEEFYNTKYNLRHDFYSCQHICGWRGYLLVWYFEYMEKTGALIVKTVISICPPPKDQIDDSQITLLPLLPGSGGSHTFEI